MMLWSQLSRSFDWMYVCSRRKIISQVLLRAYLEFWLYRIVWMYSRKGLRGSVIVFLTSQLDQREQKSLRKWFVNCKQLKQRSWYLIVWHGGIWHMLCWCRIWSNDKICTSKMSCGNEKEKSDRNSKEKEIFRVVRPFSGVITYVHCSFIFLFWNSKYKDRPKKKRGSLSMALSSLFYSQGREVAWVSGLTPYALKIRD